MQWSRPLGRRAVNKYNEHSRQAVLRPALIHGHSLVPVGAACPLSADLQSVSVYIFSIMKMVERFKIFLVCSFNFGIITLGQYVLLDFLKPFHFGVFRCKK